MLINLPACCLSNNKGDRGNASNLDCLKDTVKGREINFFTVQITLKMTWSQYAFMTSIIFLTFFVLCFEYNLKSCVLHIF